MTERHEETAEVARLTAEREAQRTAYAMQGVERDSLSDRVMALEARLAAGMPEVRSRWSADGTRPTRPEKYAKGSHEVAMVKYHEVLMENYADELADYATALEAENAALRARIAELETLVTTLIDRIDDWMVPCPDCNGEGSTERGCSRHGGGCDCEQRTASMTCDRCNGDGQIELVPKGLPCEN